MADYVRGGEGYYSLDTESYLPVLTFRAGLIRDIEKSKSRATGEYGKDNKCIPGEAAAWLESIKTPFNVPKYQVHTPGGNVSVNARWALYQVEKCGQYECSVHESRTKRKKSNADGLNPHRVIINTDIGSHACLILDAKSSRASEENSLYGIRDNEGFFWSKASRTPRSKTSIKKKIVEGAIDSVDGLVDTLNIDEIDATLQSQSGDPEGFEDVDDDTFYNTRDENNSKYQAVRFNQIVQLMEYERACCVENVPFTKYLIIVEKDFMVEYFRSILTPNGIVVKSAYRNGETRKA